MNDLKIITLISVVLVSLLLVNQASGAVTTTYANSTGTDCSGSLNFTCPLDMSQLTDVGNNNPKNREIAGVVTDTGFAIIYVKNDTVTSGAERLFFAKSDDGGLTGSTPVDVSKQLLADRTIDENTMHIFENNGTFNLFWREVEPDPLDKFSDIFHSRSTDGGVTFSNKNFVLNNQIGFDVLVNGDVVDAVTIQHPDQPSDIKYRQSTNGGLSFGSTISVGGGNNECTDHHAPIRLIRNGDTLVAVWHGTNVDDGREGICSNKSTNNGASWSATVIHVEDFEVTSEFQPSPNRPEVFEMFNSGSDLTVIWQNEIGSGLNQSRSTDLGSVYGAESLVFTGTQTIDLVNVTAINFTDNINDQSGANGEALHQVISASVPTGANIHAITLYSRGSQNGTHSLGLYSGFDLVKDLGIVNSTDVFNPTIGNPVTWEVVPPVVKPSTFRIGWISDCLDLGCTLNAWLGNTTVSVIDRDSGQTFPTLPDPIASDSDFGGELKHTITYSISGGTPTDPECNADNDDLARVFGFGDNIWIVCNGDNLFIKRSTDGGVTYGSFQQFINRTDSVNGDLEMGNGFADGNLIQDNRVFFSAVDGNSTNNENIFAFSSDNGATWDDSLRTPTGMFMNNETFDITVGNQTHVYLGFARDVISAVNNAWVSLTTFANIDQTDPVITLLGDDPAQILGNQTYIEAGATATDNIDGDLTSSIVVGGDVVDTSVLATYIVTFDVSDEAGNSAQETRTVEVVEQITQVTVTTTTTGGGASEAPVAPPTDPVLTQEVFEQALAETLAQLRPQQLTGLENIVQTFFEFVVIDTGHDNVALNSFFENERLGFRWSTGQDIIIISVIPSPSPFAFTFEQVPVIKQGSQAVISTDFLVYDLQVPRQECSTEVTTNCVQKVRYEIPIQVTAIIANSTITDTGTITVDLVDDLIDPIVIILLAIIGIPLLGGLILMTRSKPAVTTIRRNSS